MRLSVHNINGVWTARLMAEGEAPPGPGTLKGLGFFGATREEAEREALASLGCSESVD